MAFTGYLIDDLMGLFNPTPAEEASNKFKGLMGDMPVPEQQYDVAMPDETASQLPQGSNLPMGASPFGLMNVEEQTIPAQAGTGLWSDAQSPSRNYQDMATRMINSGNSILQEQGFDILKEYQNEIDDSSTSFMDIKDLTGINNKATDMLKETQGIYRGAQTLEGLLKRGTPASQVASTFAFMKSIDPSSTVRESELGMVYSAEGLGGQIASMLNKALGEGGLTASNFKDIVNTAKNMANTAIGASTTQLSGFLDVYGDRMRPETRQKIVGRMPKAFLKDPDDMTLEELLAEQAETNKGTK